MGNSWDINAEISRHPDIKEFEQCVKTSPHLASYTLRLYGQHSNQISPLLRRYLEDRRFKITNITPSTCMCKAEDLHLEGGNPYSVFCTRVTLKRVDPYQ